jgi:hypothetical protein
MSLLVDREGGIRDTALRTTEQRRCSWVTLWVGKINGRKYIKIQSYF